MKIIQWILRILLGILLIISLTVGFLWLYLPRADFETADDPNRMLLVHTAIDHLGVEEDSIEHHGIVDTYNTHEPLAQGYAVKYDDDWCATFVSCIAIQCDLTDFIPTECSCQRQIGLWMDLGRWEENDTYLPLSGDIIYYNWDVRQLGNNTGWSDHVGIVAGTLGPFIKVIEGNMDDEVGYRFVLRWDPRIRGYGLPNY